MIVYEILSHVLAKLGMEEECRVIPIQFVNRVVDVDEEGRTTEDLQLYAAVLCVGRRHGPHMKRYQAYILFKLIDTQEMSLEERDRLSSVFGHPLRPVHVLDNCFVFEGFFRKSVPHLFFTVIYYKIVSMKD